MSRCQKGSRKWREELATVRNARRDLQLRDRDAIRKFARWLAQHFDVAGFKSLRIKTMSHNNNPCFMHQSGRQ